MSTYEQAPKPSQEPQIIFDELIAPEEQHAMQIIATTVAESPEFFSEILDAYIQGPAAFGRVVSIVCAHPEGAHVLGAFKKVMEERIDMDVSLDEETEEAIQKDTYYQSVKRDFDRTREERFRDRMRERRWRIFTNRSRAA